MESLFLLTFSYESRVKSGDGETPEGEREGKRQKEKKITLSFLLEGWKGGEGVCT